MAVSQGVILLNQGIAASPFTSGSFTVANADATLIVLFQASFQTDPTDIDLDGVTPFTEVVLANYNGNMPLQAWVLTGVASGSHTVDVSGHGTGDNAGQLIVIEYEGVQSATPVGATDNPTPETEGYVATHNFDLATVEGDMVLAALLEMSSDGVTSGGDRVLYDGGMGYGEGQIEEYDGLAGTTNVNWAAHNVEFGSIGLVLQAAPPTVVTSIIREDGTGDYTSLAAWQTAVARDLVAVNEIARAEIQGTWTNPESPINMTGWTTNADCYVEIEAVGDARHNGQWSDTAWRLSHGTGVTTTGLSLGGDYARAIGLQLRMTSGGGSSGTLLDLGGGFQLIEDCILDRADSTPISTEYGVYTAAFNRGAPTIRNCLFTGAWATAAIGGTGGNSGEIGSYCENVTIVGAAGDGILAQPDRPSVAKNCVVYDCTGSDYSGTFDAASTNNASEDGTHPGANGLSLVADPFVDSAGGDFRPAFGSALIDAGTDLSADFPTDILETTRTAPWTIGAFEEAAAKGVTERVIINFHAGTGAITEAVANEITDYLTIGTLLAELVDVLDDETGVSIESPSTGREVDTNGESFAGATALEIELTAEGMYRETPSAASPYTFVIQLPEGHGPINVRTYFSTLYTGQEDIRVRVQGGADQGIDGSTGGYLEFEDVTPDGSDQITIEAWAGAGSTTDFVYWNGIILDPPTGGGGSETAAETDGALLGESLSSMLAASESNSDGVALGEDITNVVTNNETPEGLALGDAAVYAEGEVESVADSIVVSDSPDSRKDASAPIVDSVSLGEDLETYTVVSQDPEGISLGDAAAYAGTTEEAISDGVELGEDLETFTTTSQDPEGISLGDSPVYTGAVLESLEEGALLGENLETTVDFTAPPEGISLGEDLSTTMGVNTPDGIALGDDAAYAGSSTESVEDGASLGEDITNVVTSSQDAEGVSLGDTVAYSGAVTEALADGVTVGDAATHTGSSEESVTDGIDAGDLTQALWNSINNLSDGVVLSESLDLAIEQDTGDEGVALGDSVASQMGTSEGLTDGASLGEDFTISIISDDISDAVVLSDLPQYAGATVELLSDEIQTGDVLSGRWDSTNALTESVDLSDETAIGTTGSLSDALSLSDLASPRIDHGGSLVDGVSVSGIATLSGETFESIQDAITLQDNLSAVAVYGGQLTEGIAMSDEITWLLRVLTNEGVVFGEEVDTALAASFSEGLGLTDGIRSGIGVTMADGVSMYDKPARGDNVELAGGTRFGDVISAPIGRVLVLLESGIFADVVSESVVPGRDLADILDLTVYLLRQLDEDVEIKRSKSFDIEL